MTFEEYKKGLKEVAKNNDEFDIKLYNANVNDKCDFKVSIGDLVDNMQNVSKSQKAKAGATIKLSPNIYNGKCNTLMGVVTIGITYDVPNSYKPVVEEYARFMVDHNTQLTDGSNLKMNTYIQRDYGRVRLHLMPDTDINDIIVKLDLTEQYMTYPLFVKALLKCNIIEAEQTLTK